MDVLALLYREVVGMRRNPALVLVVFVLLPGLLIGSTLVFERTVPQDVPVAVVADEDAGANDVALARAGVTGLATPVEYDSPEEATRALEREEVYIVVIVPDGLADEGANATVTVVSDHAFVPLEEPVDESASIIESEFDRALPATVTVEHERVGTPQTLSSFLVPTAAFGFVVLYALCFLPYQVRSERLVLDRLRTASRLETVLASKLAFYGAALAAPALVVAAVTARLGYDVAVVSPVAVAALGLTFLALAAVGLAVLFALDLETTALFVDGALALGVLSLSSPVFPAGFFSTTERTISQALPTHYAAVATRGSMLREAPASLYADYLLWLVATAAVALGLLELSLWRYRRRR